MKPLFQQLDNHVLNKSNQYQPLQQLMQCKRERIMVEEQGIDTAETTRFFIEKITDYNSIIDLDHLNHTKKNFNSLQHYMPQNTSNPELNSREDKMKRYTGDQGHVTNFHFVINS